MLTDIAPLLLEAASPRDASRRTLDWLLLHSRARSIALWRSDDEDLALEISIGADSETLAGAKTLWARREASGFVVDGTAVLAATRPPGTYVYVDGVDPKSVDMVSLVDGAAVAAIALRRASASDSATTGGTALRREDLVSTLRLHEWNIARVARVKGVTRKTIYDWLAKYNIPRERVAK